MKKTEKHTIGYFTKQNILLLIIFIIGSIGVYSWFVGDFILVSIYKTYIAMAQSTSFVFCLISILLFLYLNFNKYKLVNLLIKIFSIVVIIYCALIIYRYFYWLPIKLQNFYIEEPKLNSKVIHGLMSPVTAALFIFAGINIILFYIKDKLSKLLSDIINLIILIVSFILLIGYLYQSPLLYASKTIPVALPTATCFLLLSISFIRINGLPFNIERNTTIKYQLSRSFIPLIIAIIILQGYIDSNILHHQQDPTLYVALLVFISIIISTILIIINSYTVDKKLKESGILLHKSEEQYRLLFKAIPVPAYTWKQEGDDLILIDFNDKANTFTYGNVAKVLGIKASVMYKDEVQTLNDLKLCLEKKTIIEYELSYKIKAINESKYLNVKYAFVQPDLVIVYTEDISERKQAEDELKMIKLSLDASLDGSYFIDAEGRFVYVNDSGCKALGYTRDELLRMKINDVNPESKLELWSSLVQALRDKKSYSAFSVHRRKDGSEFPVEISSTYIVINGQEYINGFARDITERKQAEDKLKKSEEHFKTMFETAPLAISITHGTEVAYANPSYLKMYGLTNLDELKSYAPLELFAPEWRPVILENIKNRSNGLIVPDSYEVECLRKDGSRFPIIMYLTMTMFADGIATLGFIIDITERKQAERALRQSESLLRSIAETTSDIIFVKDRECRFIFVNPACCELNNKTQEELIGHSKFEFHPNSIEGAKFQGDDLRVMESGKMEIIEEDVSSMFGNVRTLLTTKAPRYDEQGNIIGLIGVAHDISKRKQAEQEVIKAKEKAEESEQRLLAFMNSIPDIVCYKDGCGRWMLANNADLELFGLNEVDYFGKTDIELAPFTDKIFEDTFKACVISDEEAWKKGHLINVVEKVITPDGEEKYFGLIKIPIFKENGERKALAVIGRDITSLLITQRELKNAKDRAEESDRLKSAFLANMSHEIRTPMNGIMGFADLLKEQELSGEKQLEYIRIIEKSGVRMLNIINDIISISKIEAGLMEVSISETNFNEQLDYIFTFFKPEAENKGIQLSYHKFLPFKDAIINTDKEKVYSILTNLVKNAIKYTDEGFIDFGYTLKNNFIEFYIKDSGIGVPIDRKEAIFERFVQADIEDKRALQGAGLGLAITKAYVEMLNGEIWIESEEGKGSVFYFTLPYNKALEEPVAENHILQYDNEIINTDIKILIVEDDEISDILISKMLEKISKKLLHVRTGIDAVETYRNNPDIDLILMDINLPIMDGYEAIRQIREFDNDVIIIAQTAYALIGDKEKSIEMGCNNYISKPIDQTILKNLIISYFSKSLNSQ